MNHRLHVYRQRLSVPFEYPVVFTRDVFNPSNPLLAEAIDHVGGSRRHRVLVYVDDGVAAPRPGFARRVETYFHRHRARLELLEPPRVVPGGEPVKSSMDGIRDVLHDLVRPGFCRHSCVVAAGGGAVLDAIGFATALVHRGLRLVRLPSTVVAQDDAGVGVKNGINTESGKNVIGTFAPPFAVVNDLDLLTTLPDRHWIAGAAEAFKVAIIKDENFFRFLCDNAWAVRARDREVMERLVVRCAQLHLDHIRTNGDPFEQGTARPLDFGHWSAHKLEAMSGFRVSHGEAVAVGIAIDARYAAQQEWISETECKAIERGLRNCGFPLWYEELGRTGPDGTLEVLAGLESFREHLGGALCITFPRGIGDKREVDRIDHELMTRCIRSLAP